MSRNRTHFQQLRSIALAIVLTPFLSPLNGHAAEASPEVWYMPDQDTPDLTAMFLHPELWAAARSRIKMFQFGPQQLIPHNKSETNTLDDLTRVNAFHMLGTWGIGIVIQAPAIKEWDCTGERAAWGTIQYMTAVQKAGGVVKAFALDEPLNSGTRSCSQSLEQVAVKVSAYIKSVRSKAPSVEVGDIEGYPGFSASQMTEFIQGLEKNGAKPDFFHVDVNIPVLPFRPNAHLGPDMKLLHDFLKREGIPFGIIIWSGYNPEPSDRAYYGRTIAWAKEVHDSVGAPEQLDFQSWVWRSSEACTEGQRDCTPDNLRCEKSDPPYCGKKTVPLNLPDNDPTKFTHTRLVLEVTNIFGKN